MEGIFRLMWGLPSFPLCSVWGEKQLVGAAKVEKAPRRQSLYELGLGKTTQTPGSCFCRESPGGDFGQNSLTVLGPNANCKALVTHFLKYLFSS